MEFDVKEYAVAMEEFLLRMDEIPTIVHPGTKDAMRRICTFLRIGEVEAILYPNAASEEAGFGDKVVFWEEAFDAERVISKRVVTGDEKVVLYQAFQKSGDVDWSEEEREKVDIFIRMLFMHNSRSRAIQIAKYMTFHDMDFGSYNLAYLMRTVGSYIGQGQIEKYGVCYFNFRRISAINQLVGRERGTVLMMDFLKGLEKLLSKDEFISRVGGDNFILVFLKDKLEPVKEYLMGQQLVYDEETGEKILLSVTGGFYMIQTGVRTPAEVVDRASVAVNIAKNIERKQFVFYDETVMLRMKSKKVVETMFPDAIANEEFEVYYQPKVRLREYNLAGAEALCRWIHQGKMMQPGQFIPILEQSNAICTLDFYMLEHVCRDIRQWIDEGKEVVKVSVNLSRRHMGDPELLEHILSIIDKYQVPHEYIEIELTETTTDVAFNDLKTIVFGLQEQGISTSVDDFGVGYSSLNLIKELPWNVIKIDKSFLEQHESNHANYIMLKQVIAMAQELGMEVIVEGVETVEHIKMLKENNCYMAQGFYFDRPLPKEEFVKRIITR